MARTTPILLAAIALLMIDSIIEISFISSMVSWLHRRAGRSFAVHPNNNGTSTFSLHGKPLHMLADQGHTSNGAAGTAFILVGLLGLLVLWLRHHNRKHDRSHSSPISRALYNFWLFLTVISAIYTLAALIYTFVITNAHTHQHIDLAVASRLDNRPYPNYVAYPLDSWTPENWFGAVLELRLASASDRADVASRLRIMRGWRWNLIPMFVLGLVVAFVAVWDWRDEKMATGEDGMMARRRGEKNGGVIGKV